MSQNHFKHKFHPYFKIRSLFRGPLRLKNMKWKACSSNFETFDVIQAVFFAALSVNFFKFQGKKSHQFPWIPIFDIFLQVLIIKKAP